MGNVMFEIEVIKSRLDAMKSLLDSQGEPSLSAVSKLSNEVKLLQIDLEKQKFKSSVLEVEVKLLRKEINIIKSNRNTVTCPTGNTEVMLEQCTSYSSSPTMNNIEPLVDASCYEINPLLNQQADNAMHWEYRSDVRTMYVLLKRADNEQYRTTCRCQLL